MKGHISSGGICNAPNIVTISLSGNRIEGELPYCLNNLTQLVTFRASYNKIGGKIPPLNLHNMTKLQYLDLSWNQISGRVPGDIGDMSHHLVETKLELNHLSCELPPSLLHWHQSQDFSLLSIFNGNKFACPEASIFTMGMSTSTGIAKASPEDVDAYSCGGSNYLIVWILLIVVVAPVYFVVGMLYHLGKIHPWFTEYFQSIHDGVFDFKKYQFMKAVQELYGIYKTIIVISVIGGLLCLYFSLGATSCYECAYMELPTIGIKKALNIRFSMGVGMAVGVTMFITVYFWLKRYKYLRFNTAFSQYEDASNSIMRDSLASIDRLSGVHGPGVVGGGEGGLRMESFESNNVELIDVSPGEEKLKSVLDGKPRWQRVLDISFQILFILFTAIAPNVAYVWVVTSSSTSFKTKLLAIGGITAAKILLTNLSVSKVTDRIVKSLITKNTVTRCNARLNISIILCAVTTILAPIVVAITTDMRCAYYAFFGMQEETNSIQLPDCVTIVDDVCTVMYSSTVNSNFQPTFEYSGDQCVSAILDMYGPVMIATVLSASCTSAFIELAMIPWLIPKCYQYRDVYPKMSYYLFRLLTMLSINGRISLLADETIDKSELNFGFMDTTTRNINHNHGDFILANLEEFQDKTKFDTIAQKVVGRAFLRLSTTLMFSLTFGIAVPLCGLACLFAAHVQIIHYLHVLKQVIKAESQAMSHSSEISFTTNPPLPNLKMFHSIPVSSLITLITTALIVWFVFSYQYFLASCFWVSMVIAFFGLLLLVMTMKLILVKCCGDVGGSYCSSSSSSSSLIQNERIYSSVDSRSTTEYNLREEATVNDLTRDLLR